jgi:lysophospholipase L1-like esterase
MSESSQPLNETRFPARRSPARDAALRIAAAGISILLTLLVLEAGLRLFRPVGLHPTDTFLAQKDVPLENDGGPAGKTGSMALVPLASTRYRTDEFDTTVRVNSLGLRDREIPYEKAAGTYRVLVLGDSQTFGVGVEAEESYPKVAERLLEAAGRKVEVINAGVPGTGTAHQLDFLERDGWRYAPDAVVVGFFYNDVGNNATCRLYEVKEGRLARAAAAEEEARPFREIWAQDEAQPGVMVFYAPREAPPVAAPRPSLVIRHSHLARFTRERLSRIRQARAAEREADPGARGQELTAALLDELSRQCRERGAACLVALLPSREECASPRFPSLEEKNAAFLRREPGADLEVLDLLPAFRAAGYEPLFFRRDLHFTAAGHRLVGEELAKRLLALDPGLAGAP